MRNLALAMFLDLKNRANTLLLIAIVGAFVLAPDLIMDQITHLLHICYESISFLLEEILIHGIGFTKHHAQMFVFYFFFLGACGLLGWLWKRLPTLILRCKTGIQSLAFRGRDYVLEAWLSLSATQKTQLLLVNLIGLWFGATLLM